MYDPTSFNLDDLKRALEKFEDRDFSLRVRFVHGQDDTSSADTPSYVLFHFVKCLNEAMNDRMKSYDEFVQDVDGIPI